MSLTRQLAAASAQVDLLATFPGVDRGTRASALAALSRRIDEHVRRLAREIEAERARLNPVSQREGD